jgi:hypothetical protein
LIPLKRFKQGNLPRQKDFSVVTEHAETTRIFLPNFLGVIDPTKTISVGSLTTLKLMEFFFKISAGSLTSRKRFQQGPKIHHAETISAESLTALKRFQRDR